MANRENSDVAAFQYLGNEVAIPPTIYAAAAKFFAAYIVSNKVTNENEPAMLEKSIGQALALAPWTVSPKESQVQAGRKRHHPRNNCFEQRKGPAPMLTGRPQCKFSDN